MDSPSVLIVDDSDTSRLTYAPAALWSLSGNPLLEYKGTTHVLSTGPGTVQFPFNGTRVEVYGTIGPNALSTAIDCKVDGSSIDVSNPITAPSSPLYNQLFCSGSIPDSGEEHTLVISVNPNPSQTFFLDYILYDFPLPPHQNAVPAGSTASLIVDDRQSDQVSFVGSWSLGGTAGSEYEGTTHGTNAPSSSATFKFQGIQVAVYGTIPDDVNNTWVTTYSIDGQPSIPVNSSALQGQLAYHILFYDSPVLQDGNHTLTVNFASGGLEFWLDYFIYTPSSSLLASQTSTVTQSSPTILPSSTPTSPQTDSESHSSISTPQIIGIAVGSAVGGVLVILILFILFRLLRRRELNNPTNTSSAGTSAALAGSNQVGTMSQRNTSTPASGITSFSTGPQSFSTHPIRDQLSARSSSGASVSISHSRSGQPMSQPPPYLDDRV